jgi:hypothetical protein
MARNPGIMQIDGGGGELDAKVLLDAITKQQVAAGVKSTDRSARVGNETASEANARITQGYKDQPKPELTQEGAAAGATVEFVRTGAGGVGTYKEVFPIGTPIPSTRTTEFGNVYDAQGNLVSGTGLKPGIAGGAVASNVTSKRTPEQNAAYESAKALAQSFVSAYGGNISDYFDAATGKVTSPTKAAIAVALSNQSPPIVTPPVVTPPVVTPTSTIVPGSGALSTTGTTRTAFDAFKNTLALFFGPAEISKPWVSELYNTVSGFTKSGSTPEEAFNMALLESENNPAMTDFTRRFKGIFALQKLKQQGRAVEVPTVAEYYKTQETMGNVLRSSNLGSLANEDFLGDIIGKAVSATEFGNRIVAVFDRIDNASDINKKTISRFFPTLDRAQLAKALLTGDKGAKELQQELTGIEVLSAAEQQGLGVSPTLLSGITNEQAQQIARGGGTYASTLGQFGQIAAARETEQKLAEISGVQSMGVGGLTSAVISKSAAELKRLEDLTRQEEARFAGKAGTAGSRALASQSRANRLI